MKASTAQRQHTTSTSCKEHSSSDYTIASILRATSVQLFYVHTVDTTTTSATSSFPSSAGTLNLVTTHVQHPKDAIIIFIALRVMLPEHPSLLPVRREVDTQEEEVGDRASWLRNKELGAQSRTRWVGAMVDSKATAKVVLKGLAFFSNGLISKKGTVGRSAISKSVLSTMTMLAAARYRLLMVRIWPLNNSSPPPIDAV